MSSAGRILFHIGRPTSNQVDFHHFDCFNRNQIKHVWMVLNPPTGHPSACSGWNTKLTKLIWGWLRMLKMIDPFRSDGVRKWIHHASNKLVTNRLAFISHSPGYTGFQLSWGRFMALVLVHCHFYVNHLLSVFSIDVASVSQSRQFDGHIFLDFQGVIDDVFPYFPGVQPFLSFWGLLLIQICMLPRRRRSSWRPGRPESPMIGKGVEVWVNLWLSPGCWWFRKRLWLKKWGS